MVDYNWALKASTYAPRNVIAPRTIDQFPLFPASRRMEQIVFRAAKQSANVVQLEGGVREKARVVQRRDLLDSGQHCTAAELGAALYDRLEFEYFLYICE